MIDYDKISMVVVADGPRGSGKTLLMTRYQCLRLVKCWIRNKYFGEQHKVFSNYPVGFWWKPPMPYARRVYLKPEPLNMEALYTFDQELHQCWVYIDEIDQWLDRQNWQAVTSQLLDKALHLIRKRKMNIMATLQDFNWLNPRVQFQTDVQISCKESMFSPWGRKNNVGMGEVTFLKWRDKSGIMTGSTFAETDRVYEDIFRGKYFWNCYDTSFEFDPLASKVKLRVKTATRDLIVGADGTRTIVDATTGVFNFRSEKKNEDMVLVHQAMDEFLKEGETKVRAPVLYDRMEDLGGKPVNRAAVGAYLRRLGVPLSPSRKYDLSGVIA